MENLALPAGAPGFTGEPKPTFLSIVEWILKDTPRLDASLRDRTAVAGVLHRCLWIALAGFTMFGISLSILLHLAPKPAVLLPHTSWGDGSAFALIGAYDLGLIAACGICLPSFYFYGLLGGIQATMLEVAAHAARALAVTAVVLMGLLPFYLGVALLQVLFLADSKSLHVLLMVGAILPFLAGLWGVAGLKRGFMALAKERTETKAVKLQRRAFLDLLLLAWAGVYTAVTPTMIWVLWTKLALCFGGAS